MLKSADKLPQHHSKEWRGLPVIVEWPKGSTRVGKKPDGTEFRGEMKADYGYIPDTADADGDDYVDVYIGPEEDSDHVYVVEQLDDAGKFDEYKLMLGFPSLEDAETMFALHAGEEHLGEIREIPFEELAEQVKAHEGTPGMKEAAARTIFGPVYHGASGARPFSRPITNDKYMVGRFFSSSPEVAKAYGPHVYEAYLEMKRPYIVDAKEEFYDSIAVPEEMRDWVLHSKGKIETDNIAEWAHKKGYDGVIIKNVIEPNKPVTADDYIIFNQSQIRSAKLAGHRKDDKDRGRDLIRAFIKNYEHEVDFYQEVASLVQDKLDTELQDAGIKAVVSSRAKRPSRLEKKLRKRAPEKDYKTFRDIYDDVVDLAGVRVALYMPKDREAVGEIISKVFAEVRPPKHFPKDRGPGDSLGYIADHYLVMLKPESLRSKELRYADTQIEIQVASVLMHAWAEVVHDLIYKPEKGKLTPSEMKLLKELNDLVQAGEQQLEKLQAAIENRTSEELRFDMTAALQRLAASIPTLTVDEFKLQAGKIAGISKAGDGLFVDYLYIAEPSDLRREFREKGFAPAAREMADTPEEAFRIRAQRWGMDWLKRCRTVDIWRVAPPPEELGKEALYWIKPEKNPPSPAQTSEGQIVQTYSYDPEHPDKPIVKPFKEGKGQWASYLSARLAVQKAQKPS